MKLRNKWTLFSICTIAAVILCAAYNELQEEEKEEI